MSKPLVEVYSRKDCAACVCPQGDDCTLCMDAAQLIDRVSQDIPFEYREVDICSSDDLLRRYGRDIPTVFINGKKAFKFKVDEAEFRKKTRREIIKASITRYKNKKRLNG